jgi:DNA-binding transcriptional regulator GbsR (MarR family)
MDRKRKEVARIVPPHPGDERGNIDRQRSPLLSPRKDTKNLFWVSSDPAGPKEEFKELIAQNMRLEGFDEISSKIVGVLFIESEEMSLEEIAIETGYSLSAVSTAMKKLSQFHVVRRFQKPGSKKAFFFLDKNLASFGAQALKMKYDNIILPSKKILPDIIEKYGTEKSDKTESELEIVVCYHRQILRLESVVKEFIEKMDNITDEDE